MGGRCKPARRARRPWTRAEDNRLLTAVERHTPLATIARRHGRTVDGVKKRWAKIAGGGTGDCTMHQVATMLGVDPKDVRRWVDLGWLDAARSSFRAGRPGAAPVHRWAITHAAILAFLRDERYWPAWTIERVADMEWRDEARAIRGHAVYLTEREAAARLGYSPTGLRSAFVRGDIPSVRLRQPGPGEKGKAFQRFVRVEWVDEHAARLRGAA